MLALLVLAGPILAVAVLFVVRRRSTSALTPRSDLVVGVACGLAGLLLVAVWPSATLREWIGYVEPSQCLGKVKPPSPPPPAPPDIDALKAEVRQQQFDAGPQLALDAEDTRELARITGPGSAGRTDARWNVGGTDLGHPFVLDGRLGLVFGDTFGIAAPSGPGWRSNVLAWVDEPTQDSLTVTQMHEAPTGQAGELVGSLKINGWEQTVIPTNSVVVDDQIVLHFMSVACWGAHGRWAVRHSGLAVSSDAGRSFRKVPAATWPAGSGFAQVAFVVHDDHVYAYGIPEGRDGGIRLARVSPDGLLDEDRWRYWDGDDWHEDVDEAVPLIGPPVGELSVAWNEHHQTWLMMYLDDLRGGIIMRASPRLTGPWSQGRLVASAVQFPSLYAPYLLPGTGRDEEIRFTMSRFDTYNVYLMGARLVPRDDFQSPPRR